MHKASAGTTWITRASGIDMPERECSWSLSQGHLCAETLQKHIPDRAAGFGGQVWTEQGVHSRHLQQA